MSRPTLIRLLAAMTLAPAIAQADVLPGPPRPPPPPREQAVRQAGHPCPEPASPCAARGVHGGALQIVPPGPPQITPPR